MRIRRSLVTITRKASILGQRLKMNQLLASTSVHGFSHFVNSKSAKKSILWFILPMVAIVYCTYQITTEIVSLNNISKSGHVPVIKFGEQEDIRDLPTIKFCYSHWLFWFDWQKALNFNLTKADIFAPMNFFSRCRDVTGECHQYTLSEALKKKLSKYDNFHKIVHLFLITIGYGMDPPYSSFYFWNSEEPIYIFYVPYTQIGPLDDASNPRLCFEILSKYVLNPNLNLESELLEKPFLAYSSPNYALQISNDIIQAFDLNKTEVEAFSEVFRTWPLGQVFVDGKSVAEIWTNSYEIKINLKSSIIIYPEHTLSAHLPEYGLTPSLHLNSFNLSFWTLHEKQHSCESCNRSLCDTVGPCIFKYSFSYLNDTTKHYFQLQKDQNIYKSYGQLRCIVHALDTVTIGSSLYRWPKWGMHLAVVIIKIEIQDARKWTVTEYQPVMTWPQLLSSIGGSLGLWTGASILSFVHIIDYFFSMIPYKRLFNYIKVKPRRLKSEDGICKSSEIEFE